MVKKQGKNGQEMVKKQGYFYKVEDEIEFEQRIRTIKDLLGELSDIDLYPLITENMLEDDIKSTIDMMRSHMDKGNFDRALKRLWVYVGRVNKYFQCSEPWKLIKSDRGAAERVLFITARSLEAIAVLIWPFMPQTSDEMMKSLGLHPVKTEVGVDLIQRIYDGNYTNSYNLAPSDPLFNKINPRPVASELAP